MTGKFSAIAEQFLAEGVPPTGMQDGPNQAATRANVSREGSGCPVGKCWFDHPQHWWPDSNGGWHCEHCEPNPDYHRMRGCTPQVIGDRRITLAPPTTDLGAPGYWVRMPGGAAAEIVLYSADGSEILLRTLVGERLLWRRPEDLTEEADWGWSA